jgi:hypothetical protein
VPIDAEYNEKTLLARRQHKREKSSAHLEFQEDPAGCLSKKPFIIFEACARRL